jgi:hypothetical protein
MKAAVVKMLLLALLLYPLPWGQWINSFLPEAGSILGDRTVVAEVYDSALERVTVSGGTLHPGFDPDVLEYTVFLHNPSIEKVYLTLMPRVREYSVNCGGTTLKYGDSCFNSNKLEPGIEYSLTLRVNIPSGDARTYRVILKRPHDYVTEVIDQQVSGGKQTGAPAMVHAGRVTEYFGQNKLNVRVSVDRLEADSAVTRNDYVTIEAYGLDTEDTIDVRIEADAWRKAAELRKKLAIHLRQGMLYVDPAGLRLTSDSDVVSILVEDVDSSDYSVPGYARLASEPIRITVQVNGEAVQVSTPMFADLSYYSGLYYDRKQLGVYKYEDRTGSWLYQPGQVSQEWSVTGELTVRGSIFAVLEMSRQFEDVADHWAKLQIGVMASRGYTDGMARGKLEPDKPITRAEYAGLLAVSAGLSELMPVFPYTDVSRMGWYFEGISQAAKAGIVTGVAEERFAPDALITREQAAVMLMRALAHSKGTRLEELVVMKPAGFSDLDEISAWALKSVTLAYTSGLLQGNPDGTFKPKGMLTRAEAIAVLARLMEIVQR